MITIIIYGRPRSVLRAWPEGTGIRALNNAESAFLDDPPRAGSGPGTSLFNHQEQNDGLFTKIAP